MRRSALALLLIFVALTSAHAAGARARGVVADESGGVLPGVTVVAASQDGHVLATTVTDAAGRYALDGLPAGTVKISYQLEGFSVSVTELTVSGDSDALVPAQHLKLASKSETVEVRGEVRITPPPPPPPPRVPPPPPPPPRILKAIPEHDHDSVCGPAKPAGAADAFGTIRTGHSARGNGLFAAGDEVTIARGHATDMTIGQNYVARRAYRAGPDPGAAAGEHTAGVMQIVAADQQSLTAVVVYACDELMPGDWLAPFAPEPIRTPEPAGVPAYDRAARILLTDAGQMLGAPRRLLVIDQGADNGIRAGQRMTLFRSGPGSRRPAIIGDAVVVSVRADSATIRVQRALDVIEMGDSAAPQF